MSASVAGSKLSFPYPSILKLVTILAPYRLICSDDPNYSPSGQTYVPEASNQSSRCEQHGKPDAAIFTPTNDGNLVAVLQYPTTTFRIAEPNDFSSVSPRILSPGNCIEINYAVRITAKAW